MNEQPTLIQRNARRIVALVLIVLTGWLARSPRLSSEERASLASRFRFASVELPVVGERTSRTSRVVHPALSHMRNWISSVGGGVALGDLDGDGLSNDLCSIETRSDQVIVAPVPGTGARYEPFVLSAGSLPFDRDSMAPMGCRPGDFNEDGRTDVLVYFWGRSPIVHLQRVTGGEGRAALHPTGGDARATADDSAGTEARPTDVVAGGDARATDAPAGTEARTTGPRLGVDRFVARELAAGAGDWNTNTATAADLDGDGHVDLLFGNYFADGTEVLGSNASGPVEMNASMSRAQNGGVNHVLLFRAGTSGESPTVSFDLVSDAFPAEAEHRWTLAVGAADLDGDLLPELYFANDFGPDALLHNRSTPGALKFAVLDGEKTFTTPNSKVLGRDSFKGMSVDFGDLNGDGMMDMFVSNIADEYALEESHFAWVSTGDAGRMASGVAPYHDRSEPLGVSRSGWGWDTRFGDFDNDGTLEMLQATGFLKGTADRWPNLHEAAMGNDQLLKYPSAWFKCLDGADLSGHQVNPFYVRASDGRFYDLAADVGLGIVQVSRGIATADVDGDGDLDFAVGNQWETSRFFRNESPKAGAFLGLRVMLPIKRGEGATTITPGHRPPSPARPAIGATAVVRLPGGGRTMAQVDGGNGHSGARSADLHFGLGSIEADAEVAVELSWRDERGRIGRETIRVRPGWHTVVLGEGGE